MDFQEVKENIKDFFSDSTKKTICICFLLVIMTFCALVILFIQFAKLDSKKSENSDEQIKLVLDQELLVPNGPEIPNDYETNRKTPDKWSKDDVQKWFTLPDEQELKKLGESNDNIIEKITGAAP